MINTILKAENLHKIFFTPKGNVSALDGVSFELQKGEVLGLVGESGCGKSTLAKAIMQLTKLDEGRIELDGTDILSLSPMALRSQRKRFQMIFQDPFGSLNPRKTVASILEAPLKIHKFSSSERQERIRWLMDRVGMRPEMASRLPHEFSGGQRQRIGIARAIALNPEIIVCDEPVSALDVSVRAQVMNLLADLRSEFSLSYIFISHDLSIVRYISDRIAVMYLGQIVEIGDASKVFIHPAHHYTRALVAAFPSIGQQRNTSAPTLRGEVPSPINAPTGCRFHTRCPRAEAVCSTIRPPATLIDQAHTVFCHFPISS